MTFQGETNHFELYNKLNFHIVFQPKQLLKPSTNTFDIQYILSDIVCVLGKFLQFLHNLLHGFVCCSPPLVMRGFSLFSQNSPTTAYVFSSPHEALTGSGERFLLPLAVTCWPHNCCAMPQEEDGSFLVSAVMVPWICFFFLVYCQSKHDTVWLKSVCIYISWTWGNVAYLFS